MGKWHTYTITTPDRDTLYEAMHWIETLAENPRLADSRSRVWDGAIKR